MLAEYLYVTNIKAQILLLVIFLWLRSVFFMPRHCRHALRTTNCKAGRVPMDHQAQPFSRRHSGELNFQLLAPLP